MPTNHRSRNGSERDPSCESEVQRYFLATPRKMLTIASAITSFAPPGAMAVRSVSADRSAVQMGLAVGEKFPAPKSWGISGKKAVVFFYGADDAPSCSKELAAFDGALPDFKAAGATLVGVRNAAGVKGADEQYPAIKVVVDEADSVRTQVGIEKDLFGLLGGRETYVLDKSGTVVGVHNNQFGPETHVSTALDTLESMPADAGFSFDLSALFASK